MTPNIVDREPVWRRLEDRIDNRAHSLRNRPGRRVQESIPSFENRNFGGGIAIGILEAAVAIILKETVGIPFGSDTEAVGAEPTGDGVIYTINVDAPFENMAQAQAFIESGTGFTSVLTDRINVSNVDVLKTRVLRDTYQIEILVED